MANKKKKQKMATKVSNKTAKSVFNVKSEKLKTKKPNQVQIKLKKVKEVIGAKRAKVDDNLKQLHAEMVVPKPKNKAKALKKDGAKMPAGATNKVLRDLSTLKC